MWWAIRAERNVKGDGQVFFWERNSHEEADATKKAARRAKVDGVYCWKNVKVVRVTRVIK